MFISLLALSITLFAGDNSGETQGILAVIFVLTYIFGFALGVGAVVWIVLTEILPTRLVSKAYSLFTSINWLCAFLIGIIYKYKYMYICICMYILYAVCISVYISYIV